ncbi:glycosyltransferase [Sphingomonas sp. JC676]|uniref:glycosyltransferase n=1 Tax=Sphingomonas sp. JC676 TaxID=2768065 RepID=UPI001657C663|nr:glycosyltransferase [Sphingomonas sp. JC676]MBC9031379.1 glycosyltransferase [Sphingomonas sp. JC676]
MKMLHATRPPIAVEHITTSLDMGGAQAMLVKLIEAGAGCDRNASSVMSLMRPGVMLPALREAGCPVYSLNMRRGLVGPLGVVRLLRVTARVSPDVIQGWMYHGNFAASVAGFAQGPHVPVVWNVRHSLSDPLLETRTTRRLLALSARMSRSVAAIIYNSQAAAREHEAIGFASGRATYIPNGFDCDHYRPDRDRRAYLRTLFGIPEDAIVVALVARLHPMKDHAMLVGAVARARAAGCKLHLLMVGTGLDNPPPALAKLIAESLPEDCVTLASERTDVADWLPGIDILALSSAWGEAFPNILGEAMACGIPCVATDIGDCRSILGETGLTVPARNVEAMAAALGLITALGEAGRASMGAAARERVVTLFELRQVVLQYRRLYAAVLDQTFAPTIDRSGPDVRGAGARPA